MTVDLRPTTQPGAIEPRCEACGDLDAVLATALAKHGLRTFTPTPGMAVIGGNLGQLPGACGLRPPLLCAECRAAVIGLARVARAHRELASLPQAEGEALPGPDAVAEVDEQLRAQAVPALECPRCPARFHAAADLDTHVNNVGHWTA